MAGDLNECYNIQHKIYCNRGVFMKINFADILPRLRHRSGYLRPCVMLDKFDQAVYFYGRIWVLPIFISGFH